MPHTPSNPDADKPSADQFASIEADRAFILRTLGWQPIATAPKDGTTLILFSPDASEDFNVFLGHWGDDDDFPDGGAWWPTTAEGGFPIDADPTHWQSLPEPPVQS